MISEAQRGMYLSIWGQLRRKLRAGGMAPKAADEVRHDITRAALGRDKSSSKFTNADLDLVKKEMLARLDPSQLGPQMEDHDRKRHLGKLDQLLEELGKPRVYAEAIAERMAREKKISSGDLERMPLDELRKIIGALVYQTGAVKRPKKEPPAEPAGRRVEISF